MLLESPGQLVTREELRTRLWPTDTFVDFDHGLNAAVNKLRDALSESAEKPTYVETLPRRGYRFISAVDLPDSLGLKLPVPEMPASLESPVVVAETHIPSRYGRRRWGNQAFQGFNPSPSFRWKTFPRIPNRNISLTG